MSNKPDVLIIGAGIIGCCLAYEMSKAGFRTLNVDFQPVAGAGSTGNSCGNVRFYSIIENPVLRARSEITGFAMIECPGVLE